ncbi:hypothetical protein [Halorussus lipolyticus]|nr:hypothetical protein [Halorussus sp. DT80]
MRPAVERGSGHIAGRVHGDRRPSSTDDADGTTPSDQIRRDESADEDH